MTTLQQRLHDELVRRNYPPTTIRELPHAFSRRVSATIADVASIARRRRSCDAIRPTLFEEHQLAVGTVVAPRRGLRFFYRRVLKRRA